MPWFTPEVCKTKLPRYHRTRGIIGREYTWVGHNMRLDSLSKSGRVLYLDYCLYYFWIVSTFNTLLISSLDITFIIANLSLLNFSQNNRKCNPSPVKPEWQYGHYLRAEMFLNLAVSMITSSHEILNTTEHAYLKALHTLKELHDLVVFVSHSVKNLSHWHVTFTSAGIHKLGLC
jgi:hypothetical protein